MKQPLESGGGSTSRDTSRVTGGGVVFSNFRFLKSHKYRVLNLGGGVPIFTFFPIFNKYWVLKLVILMCYYRRFQIFLHIFRQYGVHLLSFIHRFNNYLLKLVLKLDYNRRSTNYFLIRRKKKNPREPRQKPEWGVYFSTLPSACETINGFLSNESWNYKNVIKYLHYNKNIEHV